MYLECESPTHLQSFIHGYTFERDLGNTCELNELFLFKFNYYDPPFGWAHMIEQQREDKQDAFHLFYELWDEFRKIEHKTVAESFDIEEDKIDRNQYEYARVNSLRGSTKILNKPIPTRILVKRIEFDLNWYALIAKEDQNRTLYCRNTDDLEESKDIALRIFGGSLNSWHDVKHSEIIK